MVKLDERVKPEVLADLLRQGMSLGQRPFLVITSGSMRPLLRVHDAVQLEPVVGEALHPGDLITIQDKNTLITHRFLGWWQSESGLYLLTRGDRSLVVDAPWPTTRLVGRVVARRRRNRWLSFQKGVGGWLTRHVARIAAAEQHLFRLVNIPDGYPLSPLTSWTRSDVITTFIRRLIYLWLISVAACIELIATSQYP